MKLSIRDFSLPDKGELDSAAGIPAIEAGQVLQIKQGDVLIAEGEYRAE